MTTENSQLSSLGARKMMAAWTRVVNGGHGCSVSVESKGEKICLINMWV